MSRTIDTGALSRSLAWLLEGRAATAALDPSREAAALFPEEESAVARAVPRRRREFAGGRAAARRALQDCGHPPAAIPAAPDRAPLWPDGFTGSIAHCDSCCIAAAARTGALASLGIDLEPAEPLDADLLDTVCTPDEARRLAPLPQAERGLAAARIFSAKEAAFKAQYPHTRAMFDFHALEVTFTPDGSFNARFRQDVAPFRRGHALSGRSAECQGLIVTAVAIVAKGLPPGVAAALQPGPGA